MPVFDATNFNSTISTFARYWKADWVISLYDAWTLQPEKWDDDLKVAAWVPIDHHPPPAAVLAVLMDERVRPIAMSRFGEQWLKLGEAGSAVRPARGGHEGLPAPCRVAGRKDARRWGFPRMRSWWGSWGRTRAGAACLPQGVPADVRCLLALRAEARRRLPVRPHPRDTRCAWAGSGVHGTSDGDSRRPGQACPRTRRGI